MKHPLFVLALIFCLGIFSAELFKLEFILIFLSACLLFILGFFWHIKKKGFNIFIYGTVFLLGASLLINSRLLSKYHIVNYLNRSSKSVMLEGFVLTKTSQKYNQTTFILRAQKIFYDGSYTKVCGDILIKQHGESNWHYGETLLIFGSLYRPFGFTGDGRGNYRRYLNRQGIYAILNATAIHRTPYISKRQGYFLKKLALRLKLKMEDIIYTYLSSLSASMLDAMILGGRRNIPYLVNNSMIKSGTVHILVVSGFNVGIVAFIIFLFLKLIRLNSYLTIIITILLLIVYCLLTGASTPVVRATVMAIVFLAGFLLKRVPDIYNSCGLAALFILGVNPEQLFDAGFQLSFISVLSIIYFSGRLERLLCLDGISLKPLKFIINSCLVSFSAWLGTMGLVAVYFKIFSPVTVLANLFIASFAVLITLSGLSLVAAALICPGLAHLFANSNELLVFLLLKVNAFLIQLPGAYFYLS